MSTTTQNQAPAASKQTKRRIASLDWARGWMLIASVSVNSLLVIPKWFGHARWEGVNPIDWIFPTFVTLSGCGLAFALGKVVRPRPLIKRFVVLMVVGLIYNAVMSWSLNIFTWRISGILQLYAVLVALISLMHIVTKSWQGWAVLTGILAFGHSYIVLSYGQGCPAGVTTPSCNPSGVLDSLIYTPAHMYVGGAAGYDTEGIVTILGALVSAAAGATVGHMLTNLNRKNLHLEAKPTNAIVPLLLLIAYFLFLAVVLKYGFALAFGADLPIMKKLWTAPFALILGATTAAGLLLGHLLVDRHHISPWFKKVNYPLTSLGRNSLFVYFGSHVLTSILNRSFGGHRPVSTVFADLFPSIIFAQVVWTAIMLAFWVPLATWMNTKKIYLRP